MPGPTIITLLVLVLVALLQSNAAAAYSPPVCPTTDAWQAAMNTGNKGALDQIVDSICGTNNQAHLYAKIACGGSPTCTKYCFTCNATSTSCLADISPDGTVNNVKSCSSDVVVCRSSANCTTHGGNDNSGTCPVQNDAAALRVPLGLIAGALGVLGYSCN
ncbi:hypothetical protein HDU87_008360 [Geranomyces variabilis]|uniref:Uncharacterized protein n=1 Tax=Geranomyces variabilis TaxID=109894 RepID=A0AAD5XJ24_9FUNG|nr:hypothetical protein HDU87_008360 [Geranomyces variabilis]